LENKVYAIHYTSNILSRVLGLYLHVTETGNPLSDSTRRTIEIVVTMTHSSY